MGEVVWPHPPEAERQGLHGHWPNVKALLPSMAWVVVMVLRQCNDQVKVGRP
jgi:hypothetical protein